MRLMHAKNFMHIEQYYNKQKTLKNKSRNLQKYSLYL